MIATHLILIWLFAPFGWAESTKIWKFVADIGGIPVPLSAIDFGHYSVFSFGSYPIKLFRQDNYVFTIDKSNTENVGFLKDNFGFGPKIPKTSIDFDDNMRIQSPSLYSCQLPDSPNRVIKFKMKNEGCFKVEIYLFPFEDEGDFFVEEAPEPEKLAPEPEKDASVSEVIMM